MNPLTGRFMSRDPGDGDVTDSATLHKYLYADADPVNGSDPTGWMDGAAGTMPGTRAGVGSAIGEYAVIVLQALSVSVAVADVGCAASTAYYVLAADLRFDTNITKGKCEARGEGRMRVQLAGGPGLGMLTHYRRLSLAPHAVPQVSLLRPGRERYSGCANERRILSSWRVGWSAIDNVVIFIFLP